MTSLLNRAVTLSTEAANGTLNSNQVSSANQEYQNILSEIQDIGVSTNYNSRTVFSANPKTVFVSDGTAGGCEHLHGVYGHPDQGCRGPDGSGGRGYGARQPDADSFHPGGRFHGDVCVACEHHRHDWAERWWCRWARAARRTRSPSRRVRC